MATAAERAKTERIKQLLSSYYGNTPQGGGTAPPNQHEQQQPDSPAPSAGGWDGPTQQLQPAAAGGGGPGERALASAGAGGRAAGAAPSISLDSPAFNPDRHIAHMIQVYNIDRLLAEHKGMAREIKNLDSDMQQLVYENYNKFITATDTIRAMKSNVDGMEADMEQLRTNMESVVQRSTSVNAKLLKRRQHIEELNRVQGLLVKLQAVFDLPSRMQAALQEDALDGAVGLYSEALPVLRKYGHKGAFRGVVLQADAAAKDIALLLKRRLAERPDDTENVVLLLRQLGEGDDMLQDKYLEGRQERMRRILADASAVADAMAAAAAQLQGGGSTGDTAAAHALPVEVADAWGLGPGGAASLGLAGFVRALDERLINAMRETVSNMNDIFLQNDRAPARRKPLVSMAKQVMNEYFKLVRRVVATASSSAVASAACLDSAADKDFSASSASLNFADNWGAELVVQAMAAVSTDVGLLHTQLPELSLRDWAAAAVEQAVQGHIGTAFAALRERMTLAVGMLQQPEANNQSGSEQPSQALLLQPAYHYLCEVIQRGTRALVRGLRVYEQGKLLSAWQDQLSDAVQAQLQAMFQGLSAHFMQLAKAQEGAAAQTASTASSGTQAATLPAAGTVLLLAKLCAFMETTTVPHVVEVLAVAFQGSGSRGSDGPPQFVGGEVARRLGTTAHLLLSTYVSLRGRSLSLLVQQAVVGVDWSAVPPPTVPQPLCGQLLQVLARAEDEVSALLEGSARGQGSSTGPDGGGGRHAHHQRGSSLSDARLESGAVERGVAKLFRSKVVAPGLAFTQPAVMAAVAVVGLKSLVEGVRLQTLGKAGLQQLQLDVFYLRPRLLQIVGGVEAEAVAQLLDDVVAAAAERSTDPTLLDGAALGVLVQAAAGSGAPL